MDPKRMEKEAKCSKMDPNFMKFHAKSDQNPSKSIQNPSLERGPEKTRKKFEKVTFRPAVRIIDFDPKIIQNGINKS